MFFGQQKLKDIKIGNIRAYQAERAETAGPTKINMEISALQMIMKEAGLWASLMELYRPLPVPKEKVRQNMSDEEEMRLREFVLRATPKRQIAGHCLIVMLSTTMGFGELRHLRREDVYLEG
jgi:hypothetical protein